MQIQGIVDETTSLKLIPMDLENKKVGKTELGFLRDGIQYNYKWERFLELWPSKGKAKCRCVCGELE